MADTKVVKTKIPPRNQRHLKRRASTDLQHAQTAAAQEWFLDAYSKLGTILRSAQAVGIGREQHYTWMRTDKLYPARFTAATTQFIEALEHEVFRRGCVGVDEPIVYQGKIMKDEQGRPLTIKRYSDNLLMFKLKKECPSYRDSFEIGGPNGGAIPLDIGIDRAIEQLFSGLARLARRSGVQAPALEAHTLPTG